MSCRRNESSTAAKAGKYSAFERKGGVRGTSFRGGCAITFTGKIEENYLEGKGFFITVWNEGFVGSSSGTSFPPGFSIKSKKQRGKEGNVGGGSRLGIVMQRDLY